MLPSWDKSVSGLGRTSKGSTDCWEAPKQIPEVGWKKNEDRARVRGRLVTLGTWGELLQLCSPLHREGMGDTGSALAPVPTPRQGTRRLKPARTPAQQK